MGDSRTVREPVWGEHGWDPGHVNGQTDGPYEKNPEDRVRGGSRVRRGEVTLVGVLEQSSTRETTGDLGRRGT